MEKKEEEKVVPNPHEEDSEDAKVKWEGLNPPEELTIPEEKEAESVIEPRIEEEIPQVKPEDDLWGKYKNLQRKYNKLHTELRKQQTFKPKSDDTDLELMLEMAKTKGADYEGQDPIILRLQSEIAARRRVKQQEEQLAFQEQKESLWREKLENRIIEAGFDPEDERFADVWDDFERTNGIDGKFERDDRKLDRTLKNIKPTEKENKVEAKPVAKETTKQQFEKYYQERRKKELKEKGVLETEIGSPAGGALPLQEIEKRYIESKVSMSEYEKAMRDAGKI